MIRTIIAIGIISLLLGCSTFDKKDISVFNRDGKITIKAIKSYNQAPIEGTSVDVLTRSGQIRGAGKIISGEIRGGSGDVEIIIRGTGNLGFKELLDE